MTDPAAGRAAERAPHATDSRRSAFTSELGKAVAICAKDLRIEWRRLDSLPSIFFFSMLVMVILNFAFDFATFSFDRLGPGVLWVAITFGGVLGFRQSFLLERDSDCMEGLMLAPVDPGTIYLGKLAANLITMLIVEAAIIPLCAVLFSARFDRVIWPLSVVVLIHTVGFASVGTLFGALTSRTRRGDVLLPILLFGVSIPIMISAVRTTSALFNEDPALDSAASAWLTMASVFDVVFLTAAYLTFEYIIED